MKHVGHAMPINDFRELQCWQLANELRRKVIAICATDAAAQDRRFRNGFMDAAGSVCRNMAEGFRRFESAYIVQFLHVH
jgi:four helix bundle protein